MDVIESQPKGKPVKIIFRQSVSDRLDAVREQVKKNNLVFNFNFLMDAYAEKLIAQAEEKLKAIA